jgi:hypothetical protein
VFLCDLCGFPSWFFTGSLFFFAESGRIFINIAPLANACNGEWVEVKDYANRALWSGYGPADRIGGF